MEMYIWYHIHSKQKAVGPDEPKEIQQKEMAEFKSIVRLIEGNTVDKDQEW